MIGADDAFVFHGALFRPGPQGLDRRAAINIE
jgi:hypothetical protein